MTAQVQDLAVLAIARPTATVAELVAALDLEFVEVHAALTRLASDGLVLIGDDSYEVTAATPARHAAEAFADELEASGVEDLPGWLPLAPFLFEFKGIASRESLEAFGDEFPRLINTSALVDILFTDIVKIDSSLRYVGGRRDLIVACLDDTGRTGVCRSYTYDEFDTYTTPAALTTSIRTIVAKTLAAGAVIR